MKKVVCGCFGTIYYAQILKNGMMSSTNREDITDDALAAVLSHIMDMKEYKDNDGYSGYNYKTNNGEQVLLVAFDRSKWKLTRREDDIQNKENKTVVD